MINIDKILIRNIKEKSIADEIGVLPGDFLLKMNGENIVDILDYKFNEADSYVELEIEHKNGEIEIYEIEKDESEELGLEFETELIDNPRRCYNKCIFCFMEQLPKNARDTLIFKDDDYRLSFFTGNYITLTNMKKSDIDRIIKYRLSPINISIHATDESVRCMMLNNKNAGKVLSYLKDLYNAGISMNTQIVLCKNVNDREILEKTISDLANYAPVLKSICIVPVGLSKEREKLGLYPLEPIDKKLCIDTIKLVEKYQKKFKKKYGKNLCYLADEFYLKANIAIPDYTEYDEFLQLENGVGMISLFENEFNEEILKLKKKIKLENIEKKKITLITGKITEEFIKEKVKQIVELIPNLDIKVVAPINNHFGEEITVTGLVTGDDIISTLKNMNNSLGEYIVLPKVMLKEDEDVFLDDVTLEEVSEKLKSKIVVTDNTPKGLIDAILLYKFDNEIYKLNSKKSSSYENSINY